MSMERLREQIRRDKKYKQLKASFKENRIFKLNFDKLREEILTLHTARTTKLLIRYTESGAARLADEIIKSNFTDQGQRSRLTEIMLHCKRASNAIYDSVKIFKVHALSEYDTQLRAFKTKAERESAIDVLLSRLLEYAAEADSIYSLAELVVKDIDTSGFALMRAIETLKINHAPERRL